MSDRLGLLDWFDPVFGSTGLTGLGVIKPPYRTADEVGEALDRAIENGRRRGRKMRKELDRGTPGRLFR